MELLVGDVKPVLAVEGQRGGEPELRVPLAGAVAELAQVVLIEVADTYPDRIGPDRVAPVEDKNPAVTAYGERHRVRKAASIIAVVRDAYGLDVLKREGLGCDLRAHSLCDSDIGCVRRCGSG